LLIVVIGGRIIPSFTRNWLVRENPGRLPTPFGRFDVAVIGCSAAILALWTAQPFGQLTAATLTPRVARIPSPPSRRCVCQRMIVSGLTIAIAPRTEGNQ